MFDWFVVYLEGDIYIYVDFIYYDLDYLDGLVIFDL